MINGGTNDIKCQQIKAKAAIKTCLWKLNMKDARQSVES